jgi:hypothetical protein
MMLRFLAMLCLVLMAAVPVSARSAKVQGAERIFAFEGTLYSVMVVSESGKVVARLGQPKAWKSGFRDGYYSPTVHPGNTTITAVKCQVDPMYITSSDGIVKDCKIVEIALDTQSERVIASQRLDAAFSSLTWVRGGDKLLCYEGKRLTMFDRHTGERIWESGEIRKDVPKPLMATVNGPTIRPLNKNSVAIMVESTCETRMSGIEEHFGTLNTTTLNLDWECAAGCEASGRSECEYQVSYQEYYPAPCDSLCTVLSISSDGRYVIYQKDRPGLFCKSAAVLYDKEAGTHRQLAVIYRKAFCA